MKIINFKKKKNEVINNKQQELYENANFCYICKEKFEDKHAQYKKLCKVRNHCIYVNIYGNIYVLHIVYVI